MKEQPNIRYIKNTDIDYNKWDNCLNNSPNQHIYAASWFLDRAADNWDALVMGDYDFIMPLPVRRKWGISYVYQPDYCQQLGIFPAPSEEITRQFFLKVSQLFKYCDTQVNTKTPVKNTGLHLKISPRTNYILPLNMNYAGLYSGYSPDAKKNLKKAHKKNLSFVAGIQLDDYLRLKAENPWREFTEEDWNTSKRLIAFGLYKGIGRIYGIYTPANELCAAGYFCKYGNRVTFHDSVANKTGKKSGAMRLLIDGFIRENAGKNTTLDFEGSTVPGIAHFFSGFGSYPETYFLVKYNGLPLPLRWIKS